MDDELKQYLIALEKRINLGFARMDARFTEKIDRLDEKFTSKFTELETKLDLMDSTLVIVIGEINKKTKDHDEKIGKIESHLHRNTG